MSRTSVGLALLVLLGGHHAVAQAEGWCEVKSLAAARAYVPSTAAFDEAEASGEPVEIVPVEIPGAHAGDLPLDQSIVRFPGG